MPWKMSEVRNPRLSGTKPSPGLVPQIIERTLEKSKDLTNGEAVPRRLNVMLGALRAGPE